MGRIEKTVFISYRRTNKPWALFIYQNLTSYGYDVFIDFQNINSGNFETAILDNIRARAHFIVILTPSALENCKNPSDWLRCEIETAMDEKRNIVPLMVEGFDFGSPLIKNALTEKLTTLSQINGLRIPDDYPFEAMDRLRERYLNVSLCDVNLPVLLPEAKEIAIAEKSAANEAPPVKEEQLTAQTWFERGYVFQENNNFDEAIRCYTEAVKLEPNFLAAYGNRGIIYFDRGDFNSGIKDYNKVIELNPADEKGYNNRGDALREKGELNKALSDLNEAIRLKPDFTEAYFNRALAREAINDLKGALADYDEAVRLAPIDAEIYLYRALARETNNDLKGALADYNEAIHLNPDYTDAYYSRADLWKQTKDYSKAIKDYQKYLDLGGSDIGGDQKKAEKTIKELKMKLNKKSLQRKEQNKNRLDLECIVGATLRRPYAFNSIFSPTHRIRFSSYP